MWFLFSVALCDILIQASAYQPRPTGGILPLFWNFARYDAQVTDRVEHLKTFSICRRTVGLLRWTAALIMPYRDELNEENFRLPASS